jgi:hypothetical protein
MRVETVVCIGSGESLTQADVDYCAGRARVLVVNDNYKLAPWADWLYAADADWWFSQPVPMKFSGEKWTCNEQVSRKLGVHLIEAREGCGLSRDPSFVYWGGMYPVGGNSGAQAVGLAYRFRAKRIILLGYDMRGTHWFGPHATMRNSGEPQYMHWRDSFAVLAAELAQADVELLNCSRMTTLRGIPRAVLMDVL